MKPMPKKGGTDQLEVALGKLISSPKAIKEPGRPLQTSYDIKATESELSILVDLPGVDEDEMVIAAVGKHLEIVADREFDHDTEDAEEYTHLGRPYGTYVCKVALPGNADTDGMTAKYKRGVLKVRIPMKR